MALIWCHGIAKYVFIWNPNTKKSNNWKSNQNLGQIWCRLYGRVITRCLKEVATFEILPFLASHPVKKSEEHLKTQKCKNTHVHCTHLKNCHFWLAIQSEEHLKTQNSKKNIARGTTDPGYSISGLNKFSDWKWFQIILAKRSKSF